MKTNASGFIGGGRITKIFLQAFANKEQKFDRTMVFDTNSETLNALKQKFPWIEITDQFQQAANQ